MKVLLINDSTSNGNWGDRAAAISLKHMITASGADLEGTISEDDLEQSTFRAQREQARERGRGARLLVDAVPPLAIKIWSRIRRTRASDDFVPSTWDEFPSRASAVLGNRQTYRGLVESLDSADVIVIHGDGCMVGNARIARCELFLADLAKKQLGKSVVIVNHTADFDNPVLRMIAEHVYPIFDDVVFRDPISADRCRSMCEGRFTPDTGFYFAPAARDTWVAVASRPTFFDVWPDTAAFDPAAPYVCIGGSSAFPPVIIKILSHLGLPTRAPPRAPARRVGLFQTI